MEGPKSVGGAARERRGVGSENGTVVLPIRKFGGYAPEKFSKINFQIGYFLHFCKLKLSHLQCWYTRLSIRQVYKWLITGLDRYGKCKYATEQILAIAQSCY